MSINLFWPIYINLENDVCRLTYDIHFDDHQLNVYSVRISDLILRAAAEIESISKELYKANGGSKSQNIKYDYDALAHLDKLWKLGQKVVIISYPSCFQTQKELLPFTKDEQKSGNSKETVTFGWNNAYQSLKHDKSNAFRAYGTVKYMFDIMAALFLLNVFYRDDIISLQQQADVANFSANMGSRLFTLKVARKFDYGFTAGYEYMSDFDECTYLVKWTDEYVEAWREGTSRINRLADEVAMQHPKVVELFEKDVTQAINIITSNSFPDILGSDEYAKILRSVLTHSNIQYLMSPSFEAIVNKNHAL